MNVYAILAAISLLLIPTTMLAVFALWLDLATNMQLTTRGYRYVHVVFGLVMTVMVIAIAGIVGYLDTAGL